MSEKKPLREYSAIERALHKNRMRAAGGEAIEFTEVGVLIEDIGGMEEGVQKESLKEGLMELLMNCTGAMLKLGIEDGFITEKEVQRLIKEYGVKRSDVASLMLPFYQKGFNLESIHKEESVRIVTMPYSGMFKLRNYAKEKYNVEVITPTVFTKMLLNGEAEIPEQMKDQIEELRKEIEEKCSNCGSGKELCEYCEEQEKYWGEEND